MTPKSATTPSFTVKILSFLCAFIGYELAETVFLLPISGHWPNATIGSTMLLVVLFTGLIFWLIRTYLKFVRFATPPDHTSWQRPNTKDGRRLLKGTSLGFLILVVVQVISAVLVLTHTIPQAENQTQLTQLLGQATLPMTLFITIAAPITEELIFRGLLMNVAFDVRTRGTQTFNVILSTICFALVHNPTTIIDACLYGGLGLGLALTYSITRDLRCSTSLHLLNNIISMFL